MRVIAYGLATAILMANVGCRPETTEPDPPTPVVDVPEADLKSLADGKN
jgi:hypothetical protein